MLAKLTTSFFDVVQNTFQFYSTFDFQDISAHFARQKLSALYEQRKPNQEKLVVFLKLMTEFRPVFHHFFTEHYLDPVTWYERRLAYTKR